jgi:hypothetical protein
MIIQRENRVRAPASIGRIELDAALARAARVNFWIVFK